MTPRGYQPAPKSGVAAPILEPTLKVSLRQILVPEKGKCAVKLQ